MTLHVYMVGGDPGPAEALANMLNDAGYAVVGMAADILAAQTLLPRAPERPDVVLVDLDRPRPADPAEADGIRDAAGESPSLVFLTHPADVAACRRLAAGPGIPLFRPFEPPDLRSAVEKAARLGGTFPAKPDPPPPKRVSPALADRENFSFFRGRDELLYAMFEATPDLVMVKDLNGIYRAANAAFCKFLWRDRSGILGRGDLDFFPPEQARVFLEEDQKVLETGEPLILDQQVIGPRGLEWVSVTKTPVRDEEGRVCGIFVSARDISQRKTYELALNQRLRYEQGLSACSRALLSDSPEALETGLEHLMEASGASHVFLYENQKDGAGEPMARGVAEIRRGEGETACSAPPEKAIHFNEGLQRWLAAFAEDRPVLGAVSGFPPEERWFFSGRKARSVLLLPVRTGHDLYGFLGLEDGAHFRRWDAGEVMTLKTAAEMVGSFLARQRMRSALEAERTLLADRVGDRTRELEAANLELAKAARLKDEFLANMSHELRTPLTAVLGMTEALQDQVYGPLNQKQLHSLEIIERAGNHLLALINDILDISKIEAGKLELEVTPVSVPDICESSLRMVRAPAEKKGITLYSRFNGRTETILADQRRLKQILVNLLSNAVKFTPEGGMVTLTVEDRTEPGRVCFRVRDTGIGIEPEALEQIFEPFTQVDGGFARSQDGTGLGLALVRRLVHLHGGEIFLESRPGEGSTFAVALPRERAIPS
ncbi:MAG: ATP-binding protein [Desulfococcaceae bacterium]